MDSGFKGLGLTLTPNHLPFRTGISLKCLADLFFGDWGLALMARNHIGLSVLVEGLGCRVWGWGNLQAQPP